MKKDGVVINNVPIEWNEGGRGYTFFGLDAITFWTRPSLVSILEPLRNEIGASLYSLIIAYEASKGTFEDYHSMVSTLGQEFTEGFLNWGRAVSTAGWGSFSVQSIDFNTKEAVVQIDNPWEMKIFKADDIRDSVPFLSGKISGIFSHAFKTNCRCEVIEAKNGQGGVQRAVLKVSPSHETLEQALHTYQQGKDLQEQLKAANIALRRNQQRITAMLDTIGERIWETDSHMIIRYVSAAVLQKYGRPLESVRGTPLFDYIYADDIPLFQSAAEAAALDPEHVVEVKVRFIGTGNEILWVYFRFKSILDISGKHEGFLGSARNITAEIELQTLLAEQQQRSIHSAKMASLGEMAAGISHEINNPLTEIIGNAWQLRKAYANNEMTPEDFESALQAIEKMSRRISEIIKGMRLVSREGSSDPFRLTSLRSIIEETLVFCKTRFAQNDVDLRILQANTDIEIECRPSQISQVLLNLLNNAFDAIQSLPEKWVEIQVETGPQSIQIQVTDSGSGIPDDVAKKLMQPFFTTKEPGKGTGLGLSISRGIVDSHGGALFLDRGCAHTSFVIQLPKRQM